MILQETGGKEPFLTLYCREGEAEKMLVNKSAVLDEGGMKHEFIELKIVSEAEYQAKQAKHASSFARKHGGWIGCLTFIFVGVFVIIGIRSIVIQLIN